MTMFLTLLPLSLIVSQAAATPSPEDCALRMSENGNMVTIQGVVDQQGWSRGNYQMQIETRQGGSRSLSQQAGVFDDQSPKTADGLLVLSTTTTYISDGGRLSVTLYVEDEDHNASCSLNFER